MGIRSIRITKDFGEPPTRVLHEIDVEIGDGEFVSISGRSGSGKSTLLYILSSLDDPSGGAVWIDDHCLADMEVNELHAFRNQNIGFIFQFHYLLPELTALENVLLPARSLNLHRSMTAEGEHLLEVFGIGGKGGRHPSQLSGGEQQRVAIARALLMKPRYIFADEPTGNLDTANAERVMEILRQVNRDHGTTIVLVTHDPDFAASANREIHLVDGRIAVPA